MGWVAVLQGPPFRGGDPPGEKTSPSRNRLDADGKAKAAGGLKAEDTEVRCPV